MITIGRYEYDIEQVKQVLAGYAFETQPLGFDPAQRPAAGAPPRADRVERWAYRSYDCIPADDGPLTDADLLIAAGLNGELDAEAFLGMKAVAQEVSYALNRIPDHQTFWDLPVEEVGADLPPPDTRGFWLRRAWWLFMGVPNVKIALTHKTLHHKRPFLVPLLDNKTRDELPASQAWETIHRQLNQHAAEFNELEDWFTELAASRHGLPIGRLRIHDIVLWCRAFGQLDQIAKAGSVILSERK